jgi:7-cyano-7-deazaguanine synthase in queuosine biosynthesis
MLLCLHSHWALLRPCRVELPIALETGEREFWQRLVDHVTAQLEFYGSPPRRGRSVEIVDSGPPLGPCRVDAAPERAAVAFSGGKDSLVLAGLAAELTERPLLVAITSPVPWANDHVGAGRDRALREIPKRLAVDLHDVSSDFRTSWELGFSTLDGCSLGVHEVSDLPLYQAATIAVAAASGVGTCMMASEADIQYNAARGRRLLLHREFPSCSVTQDALNALLSQFGMHQASLTYPLHMAQVQGMLLRRFRAIAELQFSCWQAPPDRQWCSSCEKCFQIAMIMLAEGLSPTAVGLDPVSVLCANANYSLEPTGKVPRLHERRTSRDKIVRAFQSVPTETAAALISGHLETVTDNRVGEALAVYARLRAEALAKTVLPEPGYVTSFLDLIRCDLRAPLESIVAQHFPATAEPEFKAMSKRAQALSIWITAPLRQKRFARLRKSAA